MQSDGRCHRGHLCLRPRLGEGHSPITHARQPGLEGKPILIRNQRATAPATGIMLREPNHFGQIYDTPAPNIDVCLPCRPDRMAGWSAYLGKVAGGKCVPVRTL